MRSNSQTTTARTVDLACDQAFEDFRGSEELPPPMRAAVLFVLAPLGWLIWAGLFYGVQALLP